jgi:hypothetical protein
VTINTDFAAKKLRYFVILAPNDPCEADWFWISYRHFLPKAREKLGAKLVASGISKWGILLREFLINIENEVGLTMDNQQFRFVQDHYGAIVETTKLHDAYISHLLKEITEASEKILGAPRVLPNIHGGKME